MIIADVIGGQDVPVRQLHDSWVQRIKTQYNHTALITLSLFVTLQTQAAHHGSLPSD